MEKGLEILSRRQCRTPGLSGAHKAVLPRKGRPS